MINRIAYRISIALIFFNWICISVLLAQTTRENSKERKVLFVKTKPLDTSQTTRLSDIRNPNVLGTKPISDTSAKYIDRKNAKPAFVRQK